MALQEITRFRNGSAHGPVEGRVRAVVIGVSTMPRVMKKRAPRKKLWRKAGLTRN